MIRTCHYCGIAVNPHEAYHLTRDNKSVCWKCSNSLARIRHRLRKNISSSHDLYRAYPPEEPPS